MLKKALLATIALAALAGCSTSPRQGLPVDHSDALLASVQHNTDILAAQLKRFPVGLPVVIASAQNNDELQQVCPQGRLVADVVSSRLTQHGFPVAEVRLAKNLRINPEGETILSRDVKSLASAVNADTVIAATWTTVGAPAKVIGPDLRARFAGGQTYLTFKAVRLADGLVLGSQTFASPIGWACN